MARRTALILGAMILAATPAAAYVQTEAATQVGAPPADMPPADGARMVELERLAVAAIEARDWDAVERLVREGLALEQRHYAPDDARIGNSWAWLVRAARERGQGPETVIPLAEARLAIAQAHPEDAATLSDALQAVGDQYLAADRAGEALPLLSRAVELLEGLGEAAARDLPFARARLGMALAATGDKAAAAEALSAAWSQLQADPATPAADVAYVAWEAAVALYDTDRHAEAAEAFQTVMRLRAESGEAGLETTAAFWGAQALIQEQRMQEADVLMERVVTLERAAAPEARALSLDQVRDAVVTHGDRMRQARRLEAAEAAYRLAVEVNRTEASPGPYLASPLSRLGLVLQARAQYAEAEAVQSEALALWREARGDQHADVAAQQEQLGRTLLLANKRLESLRAFGEAAAIRQALGQEIALDVLQDQADLAEQGGLLETARQRREEVVRRLRAETPVRPDTLADNIAALAHVLYLLEDLSGAERLYREAQTLTSLPMLSEGIRTGLAMAVAGQGRGDEGEPLQRQVVEAVVQRAGPTSRDAAVAMTDLARILALRGDRERAERVLVDAQAILEGAGEPGRRELATLKMNLAVTISDQGRHEEALRLLLEAFRMRVELFGSGDARTISVIELILLEFVALGADDEAEPLAAQLARVRQDQFGSDHPILAEALQRHAYVLQNAGRSAEAERLMRRAADIMDRHSHDPRERIRYNANWAVTLLSSDRPMEALEVFRRAEAGLIERRRTAADPGWSRHEAASFRFLHRFTVQAAWKAANPTP